MKNGGTGYIPDTRLLGRNTVLRCQAVGTSPTGCQVLTYSTGDTSLNEPYPAGWHLCGLPPFATVYGGDHSEVYGDITPAVCWRHLVQLGDTMHLVVRPVPAAT